MSVDDLFIQRTFSYDYISSLFSNDQPFRIFFTGRIGSEKESLSGCLTLWALKDGVLMSKRGVILCILYNVFYTVCSIQCVLYHVFCTIRSDSRLQMPDYADMIQWMPGYDPKTMNARLGIQDYECQTINARLWIFSSWTKTMSARLRTRDYECTTMILRL